MKDYDRILCCLCLSEAIVFLLHLKWKVCLFLGKSASSLIDANTPCTHFKSWTPHTLWVHLIFMLMGQCERYMGKGWQEYTGKGCRHALHGSLLLTCMPSAPSDFAHKMQVERYKKNMMRQQILKPSIGLFWMQGLKSRIDMCQWSWPSINALLAIKNYAIHLKMIPVFMVSERCVWIEGKKCQFLDISFIFFLILFSILLSFHTLYMRPFFPPNFLLNLVKSLNSVNLNSENLLQNCRGV